MSARLATRQPTGSPARGGAAVRHNCRVQRRTVFRVPCRVRLVDTETGESRTVMGETLNVSSGGMSLQIGVDVPIGTWVETLVPHSNGDPVFLCGKVVHSRQTMTAGFEVGVESETARGFI